MTDVKIKDALPNDRFKDIFKEIPIPTYVWQMIENELILVYYNEAAKRITDGGVKDFIGVSASKLYKERPKILEDLNRCAIEGITITREMEYLYYTTSKTRNLAINIKFIEPDLVLVYTEDITERKIAERKIKESEENYRNLVNNLTDIILEIDLNAVVTYVSPQCYEIIGYQPSELLGKKAFNVIHSEDVLKIAEAMKAAFETKKTISVDYKLVHKNGNNIYASARGKFSENGRFIVVIQDVSEKYEAELKLKESEEKYRNRVENISDAIVEVKVGVGFEYASPQIYEIYGYTSEEVIGLKSFKDIHRDDFEEFVEAFKKGIRSKRERISIEFKIRHRDGHYVPVSFMGHVFKTGKKFKLTGVLRDITKMKKAEEKLKESEESLKKLNLELEQRIEERTKELKESEENLKKLNETFKSEKIKLEEIMNNTIDGISTLDLHGNVVQSNTAFANLIGYESEKLILGKNMEDFTIKDDVPKIISAMKNGFKEGVIRNLEVVGITKQGENYYASINAKLIKDENGIFQWLGVIRDITEKKRLEQKLRELNQELEQKVNERTKELKESEEKYRNIFEKSSNAIVLLDFTGKIIDCNSATETIFGYSKDELIGQNYLQLPIYSESMSKVLKERFQAISKEVGLKPQDLEIKKKDGNMARIKSNISYVKIGDQNFFQALIQDITEQKKAEQKLRDSEQRFKYLVASNPAIIYTSKISEDYGATFISDNVKEKWGYETEDFIEDSEFWIDHIHPDDRGRIISGLSELFEKGHHTHEYRFKLKEGTYHWMRDELKLLKDNKGNPVEMIGSVIDISERKKAEQKLKESEEKFRTITEQSTMGIIILQENKVIYANEALETLIEYPFHEVLTWSASEIFSKIHPDDRDFAIKRTKLLLTGDKIEPTENTYRIVTKSGQIKWIETFSRPIQFQGKLTIFITILDITEKKKAEEELIRISKLKSDIFTRASHELKTPLIAIKGYTDLLLELHKEEFDGMVLSSLNQIKRGCTIFEKTINDILNTAYLESEQVKLNLSREDLSFLIKYCISDLKGLALARNHEISVDVSDKLITTFEKERIYEVLSNLIINAIKYTPPGGEIEVKSEIVDNFYKISVTDNGIGFTEEEIEQIFKQFGKIERYGQGWDLGIEGTGLGLYISKKIVEMHGGKIWVDSEGRDKGSTFYFTLPIIND